MKFYALISAMLLSGSIAFAQNNPVLMTVGGNPVCRSEFEYAFLKNGGKGNADDHALSDFLKAYTDYQLKLKAALDAKVDTTAHFKQAWARWEGDADEMALSTDARRVGERVQQFYRERQENVAEDGGYVKTSHILLRLAQKAKPSEQARLKSRADSLSAVLEKGADFAELARKYSDDKGSAAKGGELPWIAKGQTVKRFEDTAFSLQVGEISQPVLTELGYEIIRLDGKQDSLSYNTVKEEFARYLDAKDIRERIVANLPMQEKSSDLGNSKSQEETNEEMRALREGLLVQEITNLEVWKRAAEDEKGQAAYFAKNKKKYRWVEPRLEGKRKKKGPRDYKEVQSLVIADYQDKLEKDWVETLRHKYPVVVNEEVLATVNKH